jgi:long-chain acyl-CoA synthetase
LAPGDRVAVALHNSFEWFEALNALGRLGALLVPLSYRGKGPELAYMIADSGAKLLIVDPRLASEVDRALEEAPLPEHAIWVTGDERPWRGERLEERIAAEAPEPPRNGLPGGGYNVMIYTSGTTGRPKGILRDPLPPERVQMQMLAVARMWGFAEDDVHLVAGPVYHTAPGSQGQTHLMLGATIVIMPRFDAAECLRLIARHRVTNAQMVPAMFFRILGLSEDVRRRFDLSSIRKILHAAAPCPVAVKQQIMEVFPPGTVWEFYGASEGGATRIGPDDWRRKPGSVGTPWPGLRVEIRDDGGRDVPPNEIGTIWISLTPGARFAYSGAEEKTRAAVQRRVLQRRGHGVPRRGRLPLHRRPQARHDHLGRREHLSRRGRAGALSPPADPRRGGDRGARRRDGRSGEGDRRAQARAVATADELIAFCRRDLAHYKCPRSVDLVAELPREPQGKVLKRVLREPFWAGREKRV